MYQNPYLYQQPFPQNYPNIQQNQNILPQQQVTQVNGKASVDAIRMAPNSSVLLMDSSAPMVWLCVSDGLGNVTSTGYDISVHQERTPVDMQNLETRVAKIEEIVSKMEVKDESNDTSSKRKQSEGSDQ